MSEEDLTPDATECAWCEEPATTVARVGRYRHRLPACALHKAVVERKNLYMPCVVGPRFNEATPQEQVAILKATKSADRITDAEWKALLTRDGFNPSARSRLKAKG